MSILIILAITTCSFLILRPVAVLAHELGHGLTALILTQKGADLFVGTYGEEEGSKPVSLGPFKFWFKFKPLDFTPGRCIPHARKTNVLTLILIILAGPAVSGFIALGCVWLMYKSDFHLYAKTVFFTFFAQTAIDFWFNIRPSQQPVSVYDGEPTYNDGKLIVTLLQRLFNKAE